MNPQLTLPPWPPYRGVWVKKPSKNEEVEANELFFGRCFAAAWLTPIVRLAHVSSSHEPDVDPRSPPL